ncbi:MAG: cyanase [Bryobacteraceae bacterium]|jgi:cyanate lyase
MTRADVTTSILDAKRRSGLTWKAIAEALGPGSPVFYTAALLGHHALTPEEARKAGALLKLDEAETRILAELPEERGATSKMPPTDPLIYRFYELVQGYGPTLKALINEEFGDGIMSAIDFTMEIGREPDPKGDRVRITMSGKFLPYKRF